MPPQSILIKKYENRRLYDATNSRYVNLDEVAQLLRDGNDVRVVDAASGQDITRLILTQIIVEDARAPNSAFPLDLLRQMIVSSGRATQETALQYMKAMLSLYQDTYRAMSPAVNPFEFFRPGARATPEPPEMHPQAPPRDSATPEVHELRQRVADLEKMVAAFAPKKTAARKSKRKR